MPDSPRSHLILASASPRRLELLRQVGIEPNEVRPAEVQETVGANEIPREFVLRMACSKAGSIAVGAKGSYVLGADTVVACGRRIYGKPRDENAARAYLRQLSGRRHRVYGGVSLIDPAGENHRRCVETVVKFKRLGEQELNNYLATNEWCGKAGGYAIQGRAAAFIEKIMGSYSNVVGLPLFETVQLLTGSGYRPS